MAELRRVTRPGGLLVATTWRTADGPPRLRYDVPGVLRQADWLEAQLRLYAAATAESGWDDPAVQRLRDEGEAVRAGRLAELSHGELRDYLVPVLHKILLG